MKMRIKRPSGHFNDEQLLAYLDGELAKAEAHTVQEHLKRCWKCRTLQADLEAFVEVVSRLFSFHSSAKSDRSARAKQRFLEWKSVFEKQQKHSFRRWPPHLLMMTMDLVGIPGETKLALAST